jgi:outer membrane protein with beta-barrel domain
MRSVQRSMAALLAGLAGLGLASTAQAQYIEPTPRAFIEARGGVNVPTFDITDAADPGASVGAGLGVRLTSRLWLLADADFGFHSGNELAPGVETPDVNVYHYMGKLGYELIATETSKWSFIVNAGAGAMTFDVDGVDSYTFPAINVGAKISYELTPRFSFVLSPQGDIAFTDEDDLGTTDAWVWPFTAGIRVGI